MLSLKLLKISGAVSQGIFFGFCLLLGAVTAPALADNLKDQLNGLTLHSTRVIYPHDAKGGVIYTITNNTPVPYLLQARLLPWESTISNPTADKNEQVEGDNVDDNTTAFIALPPLQRFEPGETLTLRVRQKHNLLVQDKESIAILALTAIPARSGDTKEADGAQMMVAVQNNLKLFYRPAGLPEYNLEKIEEQLQFQRTKTGLTIKNPTPFYVTFNSLSVDKTNIDLSQTRMISPFGEEHWPLDTNNINEVHWQLITDNGGSSKKVKRQLTSAR